ncbi:MAG: hypothetical protein HYT42_00065 [Candidatus Sungbacteria bacterium]|nr:hypothetical protein [Candidatus Sungbacteria bacterium]
MPDDEQEKRRAVVEAFREIRVLHEATFRIHNPKNVVAITAADLIKALFAGVMKVSASPDLLLSAVGWLERMADSNQNGRVREALAAGTAQCRR